MKEADFITIFMQRECATIENYRSVLDLYSKTTEKKKNYIRHPFFECSFKQERTRWNGCLVPDKYFESGVVKIQQGSAVDLTVIEKKACRKLLKSYKVVEDEDEDEDEELIEPAENDDVLTTHMGMANLLKNKLKRKMNNTKDEELYIDYRFIFGSAARAERLFSHCKYIMVLT